MIPGRVATPVPVWATILTRTSLKADGRAGRPPGRAASGRGPEAPGLGERAECCRAHTGSTPRSRSNAAIRLLGHLVPAAPKWRGDRAELRFGPNAVHRAPLRTASSQPLGAARVRPLELAGFSPADRRDRPGLALALPHRALGGGGWPRVPDAAARHSGALQPPGSAVPGQHPLLTHMLPQSLARPRSGGWPRGLERIGGSDTAALRARRYGPALGESRRPGRAAFRVLSPRQFAAAADGPQAAHSAGPWPTPRTGR